MLDTTKHDGGPGGMVRRSFFVSANRTAILPFPKCSSMALTS